MTQADLGHVQLRRVNAFHGLMIDATVWRDAHDYHRSQMRLHNLARHGWGIAHGKEVRLSEERNTVVVQPGIAIDPQGNFIILSEPYLHRLESSRPSTIYLLISFSEVPSGPTQPPDDPHGQPTRVIEAFRIQQRDEQPPDPRVELCRVDFDPLVGPLKAAEDPANPVKNELDLRFRIPIGAAGPVQPSALPVDWGWTTEPVVARAPVNGSAGTGGSDGIPVRSAPLGAAGSITANGAAAAGVGAQKALSLVVGRHAGQGWDAHAEGVQALARELGFAGRTLNVREAALNDLGSGPADVVYLTGHSALQLGPAERQALGQAIERGATLVGDGCAAGPLGDAGARALAHSVAELALGLDLHLEAAERSHPVLRGRYLFAAAPAGARESSVLLVGASGSGGTTTPGDSSAPGGGVVYCDADYGCAWNGGAPERPLQRGVIRDAQELGVNLVWRSARA